ncbi:MAG: hypothetical protein HRT80_09400 [Henriciella sp.]|nr:hypothetical protein [Henriciella sp.]
MLGAQLRHFALVCVVLPLSAVAQESTSAQFAFPSNAGQLYEASQSDVTVPVASYDVENGANAPAVMIPVENLATPMRCMTAWSYLAGRAIEDSETMSNLHSDFTEATASAHWQHWLKVDLESHQGVFSADFHQRRLAAERAFSIALARGEEAYAFQTLGTCYVEPRLRELGDPTQLLRNFMIAHQGLPESYAVPVLQRQLRAFPISLADDVEDDAGCDDDAQETAAIVSERVKLQCFDRGGILASNVKVSAETLDSVCRVTAAVQCENVP